LHVSAPSTSLSTSESLTPAEVPQHLGEERLSRRRREAFLDAQMISEDLLGTQDAPVDFTPYVAQRVSRVWLTAPKTTDAIYLAPSTIPPGLSIERVVGPRTLEGLTGAQVLDALGRTSVFAPQRSRRPLSS
jgi:hypothetical protein